MVGDSISGGMGAFSADIESISERLRGTSASLACAKPSVEREFLPEKKRDHWIVGHPARNTVYHTDDPWLLQRIQWMDNGRWFATCLTWRHMRVQTTEPKMTILEVRNRDFEVIFARKWIDPKSV